jgi:TRAP-type C4-dicarboxylate transport system permease small subunit
MRVYLSPTLQQLISAVTLCLALGAFGWAAWTAVNTWTSDPSLDQIQQIRKSM